MTLTVSEPPLMMMPVSLLMPLGLPSSLEPVVVTVRVPPLISTFSLQLMPLPPSPLLLMVRVPAVMVKRLSHLMPAADDVSEPSSLGAQSPEVVMVVSPPLKVVRASHLMPRPPSDLTSITSVPPLIVKPSLALMPLEPVSEVLMLMLPSSIMM